MVGQKILSALRQHVLTFDQDSLTLCFTSKMNLGTMISAGSGVRGNFSMDSSSIVLVVIINIELHGFKTFAHDIESDSMVN